MIFGYARVSTQDQNLDRQIDQLREANCEEIFKEKVTGTKAQKKLDDAGMTQSMSRVLGV